MIFRLPSFAKERLGEVLGVEGAQVLDALADADPLDRHGELALDADDDAALGRAVELRQHDACDRRSLGEELGLADGVLPRRRVEHEQRLVRRARDLAADDAVNLLELLHEVGLRLQAACCVDDQHVDLARDGCLDGVEGDSRRVGSLLVLNDGHARALAPDLELVDGRRAEGVGRGEQDRLALALVVGGELADRRRLARAVDADDEQDRRPLLGDARRILARRQDLDNLLLQERLEVFRRVDLLLLDALAHGRHELVRRLDADVRHDERLLELVEQVIVDVGIADDDLLNLVRQVFAGLVEALLEPVKKSHDDSSLSKNV